MSNKLFEDLSNNLFESSQLVSMKVVTGYSVKEAADQVDEYLEKGYMVQNFDPIVSFEKVTGAQLYSYTLVKYGNSKV